MLRRFICLDSQTILIRQQRQPVPFPSVYLRAFIHLPATMTTPSQDPEFPIQAFPTVADLEAFFDCEHTTSPGVFVKFAKKSSGIPSVTAAEAVEVALCYGWIDGRSNAIDNAWWKVRYTPRRAKSIWSQKNVNTVARLIDEGRMRPAGLAAVDAAKADGRWDRAYAGPATIVVPDDFKTALAKVPAAKSVWETMNKSERYPILLKIEMGAQTGRSKRMDAIAQKLAAGHHSGTTTAKASRNSTSTRSRGVQKSGSDGSSTRPGLRKRKT